MLTVGGGIFIAIGVILGAGLLLLIAAIIFRSRDDKKGNPDGGDAANARLDAKIADARQYLESHPDALPYMHHNLGNLERQRALRQPFSP